MPFSINRQIVPIISIVWFLLETVITSKLDITSQSLSVIRYGIIFLILSLLAICYRFKFKIPRITHLTPFILLSISGCITFILYPSIDAFVRLVAIIGYVLLFIAFYPLSFLETEAKEKLLSIITVIFTLYILVQSVALFDGTAYLYDRFMGFTINPNELGTILFIAIALMILNLMYFRKKGNRIFLIAGGLASGWLLLLTGSKAAILSLVVFLLLIKVKRRVVLSTLLISPIIIALYFVFTINAHDFTEWIDNLYQFNSSLFDILQADPNRLMSRIDFLAMFTNDYYFLRGFDFGDLLLGYGLKSFDKDIPLDSSYMMVLYEQGLFGLFSYIAFVAAISRMKSLINTRNIYVGLTALCLAMIFHANFESKLFLGINYVTLVFILVYALCINVKSNPSRG